MTHAFCNASSHDSKLKQHIYYYIVSAMLGGKHGSVYYMFSFFIQTCMAHLSVVNLSSFTPQKKLLTWGLLSIFSSLWSPLLI